MLEQPREEDFRAAALQYVRKVTGFRQPSQANREAFWRAVTEVERATEKVVADLVIRER